LHREKVTDFRRKKIEEICDAKNNTDSLFEGVRLAPSGINSQPWYFSVSENIIHAFCVKPNFVMAMLVEKMNKIDVGIALCHLWIGFMKEGKNIEFVCNQDMPKVSPKGYYYIVSIKY
jgi:hypothetical protein